MEAIIKAFEEVLTLSEDQKLILKDKIQKILDEYEVSEQDRDSDEEDSDEKDCDECHEEGCECEEEDSEEEAIFVERELV